MAKGDKRAVVMGAEKGQAGGVAALDGSKRLVQEQTSLHSAQHRAGGADPLAPADIGAAGDVNLLVNSDFGIWQRYPSGVYQGVPNKIYIADRFQVQSSNGTQTSKLVRVAGGGIQNQAGPNCKLSYRMEGAAACNSREMTLSVLKRMAAGDLVLITETIVPSGWTDGTDVLAAFAGTGNGINWLHAGETIYRYKLEMGARQTLARQTASGSWALNDPAPDRALELVKCQRYFQVFGNSNWRPPTGFDYRPAMRLDAPTVGTMTLSGGTVGYTASAEL